MYLGPPVDDPEILDLLPSPYRNLLERANGYVAYHGGLHVRGACMKPRWHSLREAWFGQDAIHRLYPAVQESDVPFAEDALGDQFLLRDAVVHRLSAETGDVESLHVGLYDFDQAVRSDPVDYLSLAPLENYHLQGGTLAPGQLLSVFPPFVLRTDRSDSSYRAIDSLDRRRSLAALARQLRELPDGAQVRINVVL
jgi:hypothetical protein